jgi:CRP-like cAMP-binding protein
MEWNSTAFAARFAHDLGTAGRRVEKYGLRRTGFWGMAEKEGTMHAEASRVDGAQAHPVAELLACPPETSVLLTASAQAVDFQAGDTIFRQGHLSRGLYLVVSGQLLRRAERMETRIVLGAARPGDLLELSATLGDGRHTYSLVAQTQGSLLILPKEALEKAFTTYSPMRMHLLEELAREVSRAYVSMAYASKMRTRRRFHPGEA